MAINLHGISREAFDLIVNEEVSGRATYEKRYVRPEKPGGQSGVTVGIGYDCGYSSAETIRKDWGGKIPQAMVEALASCAGITGNQAFAACARVRSIVAVPWEAAIDVFSNVSIPKYMAATRRALPGYDDLAPDCKGALLSLTYNRGASYTTPASKDRAGRYKEMREIRAAMIAGNLAAIPALLRSMARLWTTKSVRGVALRREHEARLFERGLKTSPTALIEEPDPAPEPPAPPVDPAVTGDPDLYSAQKRLKAMNYSPGVVDGKWGGGTSGALSGFINDRGGHIPVPASLDAFYASKAEIAAELARAEAEGFVRPVSEARKSGDVATVATVAPEVLPARRSFLATAWAAVVAFFSAAWETVSGYVSQAWDFFFDHKDDLPSDPGYLQMAWDWLGQVPVGVWLALAGIALALVAWDARQGVKKITEGVKTGARL